MEQITLTIDGTEIKTRTGESLLWAALDNGFYIPNLCAVRQAAPPLSACRLCFVEVEGKSNPVTACTEQVFDGMAVYLNTPRVQRLRSTAFELLLSHHKIDCRNCPKNGKCELQRIASRLGLKLKLKRFRPVDRDLLVDSSHELFTYDPNKCVLCGKCVWACQTYGSGILDFAQRGIDANVSTFYEIPLAEAGCQSCLACVAMCPVGALSSKQGVSLEKATTLVSVTI
jgi:bidirectional [NiFe] hydrogenase diaphorase subunit